MVLSMLVLGVHSGLKLVSETLSSSRSRAELQVLGHAASCFYDLILLLELHVTYGVLTHSKKKKSNLLFYLLNGH